jgi:hypothetical protein
VLADFLSQSRDVFLGFGSVHRYSTTIRARESSAKVERVVLNAFSEAAGLTVVPSAIFLASSLRGGLIHLSLLAKNSYA